MVDFVSIKTGLNSTKERIEKLEKDSQQKLTDLLKQHTDALNYLEQTEKSFGKLSDDLHELKKKKNSLEDEKKQLLADIDSLSTNIERTNISINEETNKIDQLESELATKKDELEETKSQLEETKKNISETKETIDKKSEEKANITDNKEKQLAEIKQTISELEEEEAENVQVSPVLDFLLKEVRTDIPEADILSTLAYRKHAIGLDDLKQSVAKTQPVIILKVVRKLDSLGIINYNEELDTIELAVDLLSRT